MNQERKLNEATLMICAYRDTAETEGKKSVKPDELKHIRKACHMTQLELAAALGLHVVTVQNYEAGKYPIPLAIAIAVQTFRHSTSTDSQESYQCTACGTSGPHYCPADVARG